MPYRSYSNKPSKMPISSRSIDHLAPAETHAAVGWTDTEILDWLQAYIDEAGAMLLHRGERNIPGVAGVALHRKGRAPRTLREALADAMGPRQLERARAAGSSSVPPDGAT